MLILRSTAALDRALDPARRKGRAIGFVPTMGALHKGHEALVRASRKKCDLTVVSIFVNPLQFESAAAYRNYPRNPNRDLALLRRWGIHAVYCPHAKSILAGRPDGGVVEHRVSSLYEGALRPGHFEGVLTIVSKLFLDVRPTHAFFGEKDFQQLWLVRSMSRMLFPTVRILSIPTVRDWDGLACSSRNACLTPRGRDCARRIRMATRAAQKAARAARRPNIEAIIGAARDVLKSRGISVEYAAIVDARDFSAAAASGSRRLQSGVPYRLLMGVTVEGVHLIDNSPITS